jgi:condensin complex subunit 1
MVGLWLEPYFFSPQICEFVQKDELKPSVTHLLWEQVTEKVPCSPLERCSSVMLLGMMAR